jgi:RNA polymerase sigma-70 factor (ECF subfamily)
LSDHYLDNEKELFNRVALGDETAFTAIFYQYTRRLYPFLLQKLRSELLAEELLQDIFLRLWVYRERLAGLESPQGYLFRMAANRVQDHFQEEYRKASLLKSMQPAGDIADIHPQETMDIIEARRLMAEGIQALPEQRRRVYELKQQGLRYEEIASQLNISPNTVRNQLVQANRFLLEFLRSKGLAVLLLILSWKKP